MRHFLLPLAVLLFSAAPALAQVTVDLHALDALPETSGSPSRRPPPSLTLAPRPPVATIEPTAPARHPTVATTTPTARARRPAVATAEPAAPAKPSTPSSGTASSATPSATAPPAAVATAQPTAPAPTGVTPQYPTPQSPTGQSPAAPATPEPPPAATLPAAPPPVASIAPIPPPTLPANAPPPPAPPIVAGATTAAAAIPTGLRLTFASGQSDLSPASAGSIKHLVQGAPPGDSTTFNVLAYASGDPDDPSVARRLSLARAIAVRAALMSDGVPSARIYLRALGSEPGQGPADRVDLGVLGANADLATGQR